MPLSNGIGVSGFHQLLGPRRKIAGRRHLSYEALMAYIRAVYEEHHGHILQEIVAKKL